MGHSIFIYSEEEHSTITNVCHFSLVFATVMSLPAY